MKYVLVIESEEADAGSIEVIAYEVNRAIQPLDLTARPLSEEIAC